MVNTRFRTDPASRRKRGMTLIEVLIASLVAAFVMAGVLAVQYISARTAVVVYGTLKARTQRMIALNEIRFRLCDALVGSTVTSNHNQRIEFMDPNQSVDPLFPDVVSAFEFENIGGDGDTFV